MNRLVFLYSMYLNRVVTVIGMDIGMVDNIQGVCVLDCGRGFELSLWGLVCHLGKM